MRVAAVILLVAAAARADGTVVPVDLVGAAGGAAPALVGSGGEVFRWADGAWRRMSGGVAGSLTAAGGPSGADVWALGRRVFHHDGKAWDAVPDAGRATALAADGSTLPGVARGRAIQVRAGGRWTALPAAPAPVVAFWVGGVRDVVAVTDAGASRWNGRDWRPIAGVTGARGIAGAGGGAIILGADAVWRGGRKLTAPAGMPGQPRGAAAAAGATFVLTSTALLRVDGDALALVAPLPDGAGEPAAILTRGAEVVVVARRGAVWAWKDGWRAEALVDVATPARGGSPPAVVR
jgi:hypothetical protein